MLSELLAYPVIGAARTLKACQTPLYDLTAAQVGELVRLPAPDRAASTNGDSSFYGTKDFPDAVELLERGCDELTAAVSLDLPEVKVQSIARKRSFAESGDSPDIPRLLAGKPCMQSRLPQRGAKIVELVFPIGANCHFKPNEFRKRGSLFLALLNAFQDAGYAVGVCILWVDRGSNDGGLRAIFRVRIKEPSEYIDGSVIAFWISHPAAFRRIGFRLAELTSTEMRRRMGYFDGLGYGSSRDLEESERSELFPEDGTARMILPRLPTCLSEVTAMLKKQGFANE